MEHALETVGELVAARPLAGAVLRKHGIDFCCGGGKALAEACAEQGVDPAALLREVDAVELGGDAEVSWVDRPLDDLIDHILARHHRPLDTLLPEITAMAHKVRTVHGPREDVDLDAVVGLVEALVADIEPHMHKEEQVLFPWVRSGRLPLPPGPVEVMEEEHEVVGDLLRSLRDATGDYVLPEGACRTWTALWRSLEALEADLHQHIHLENNVLFPRIRQG